MPAFIRGQRYQSEAEPELGLGRIEHVENRRVIVHFPASSTDRLYADQSAPIKRVAFRVGDELEDASGRRFKVDSVSEEDGLLVYADERGVEVPEAELSGTLRFSKPDERLLGGVWDESRAFDLRRRTLRYQYETRKSPARGFLGGRVELMAHQIYISQEVASRPVPRALLADEVGLGKTIEAGLIIHRLWRSGQIGRVVVLVPEPLVHQWFVEMFRRFHLSFTLVNESYCEAALEVDPSTNPFMQTQSVIVALEWVAFHPERVAELLDAPWDMLVVDEAHHLEWSETSPSREYWLVEALASKTKGLLLLTATPEQRVEESHFARLRLLDPDRYPSFESYRQEAGRYRDVAKAASKLIDGKKLTPKDGRELKALLPKRATTMKARLKSLLVGDEDARQPFIEDLLDQHGPGRVVFRNARSVLDRVPERRARGWKLDWPKEREAYFEQLAAEFVADTSGAHLALDYDFSDDVRAEWLSKLLTDLAPQKVLVLCRFKEKAIALHDALRKTNRPVAGVFHEDLTLLQRDRNAAWFSDLEDGAQALICSEIGSEGRNFQFAHHLVLFDLPLSAELLEQRIGRLYRIGQEHTVEIHVPYLPGTAQEMLFRWYHEGLDAFEQSLPSGAYFDELADLVRELALEHLEYSDAATTTEPPEEMALAVEKTHAFREEVSRTLESGRDRLLELSSYRPAVAESLIEEIRRWDDDQRLDRYVHNALDYLGVELDPVAPRTFVFRKGNQLIVEDLPGLRADEVAMTSSRDKATHIGELDFLTWDHPMVTGVMELLSSSEHGNSAVAIWPHQGLEAVLLEALFIVDAIAPAELYLDRFLPPAPVRIVVDHRSKDVTAEHAEKGFRKKLRDGRQFMRFADRSWQEELVPRMIEAARGYAAAARPKMVAASLDDVHEVMGRELRRLKALAEINDHVRPEEIERVEAETEALEAAIRAADIRLDALRLIWKTSEY